MRQIVPIHTFRKTVATSLAALSLVGCGGATATRPVAGGGELRLGGLHNPVLAPADNLRDPSVLKVKDGYQIFYSRVSGPWSKKESWSLGSVFTRDFRSFSANHDVSPAGFGSPDGPVWWHGRYIMAAESYPIAPAHAFFTESTDGRHWGAMKLFLPEANALPWNGWKRVIDPTFVVDGDTLHCFFVGSAVFPDGAGKTIRANLMGHAVTRDPDLKGWKILTPDAPLLGRSARAPDGVENMVVVKDGAEWVMIYSEGLENQHLATASSKDLVHWSLEGPIALPVQNWLKSKYGAPFVWRDGSRWLMILMGDNKARTTLGLLSSPDLRRWTLLPSGRGTSNGS